MNVAGHISRLSRGGWSLIAIPAFRLRRRRTTAAVCNAGEPGGATSASTQRTTGLQAADWRTCASSVRGASHERSGAPNQDCGRAIALDNGTGAILVVADGHGDSLHARSERGSRFAVDAAMAVLAEWIASPGESGAAARSSAAALPAKILAAWRARVAADLVQHPPTDEIAVAQAPKAELIRSSPDILYGSTLLGAAINARVAAYLQIGDGDLLTVAASGAIKRVASGRDDLPINQTESLCQPDAGDRFRVQVEFFAKAPQPVLLMASTDGYSNSFRDDDGFLKVARDVKAYLESKGIDWMARQLKDWLEETSKAGSGDDITLALAWSGPGLMTPPKRWRRRRLIIVAVAVLLSLSLGWAAWTWAPQGLKDRTAGIWHTLSGKAISFVHEIVGQAAGEKAGPANPKGDTGGVPPGTGGAEPALGLPLHYQK